MTLTRTAIIAITVCVALQITISQAEVKTVAEKTKFFGKDQLVFDSFNSFKNTTFVYATCESIKGKPDKSCMVKLAIDDLEPTKECPVTLTVRNANRHISPYMRSFLLGKDKAILAWTIKDKDQDRRKPTSRPPRIKLTIVHMSNCETRDVVIDLRKRDRDIEALSITVVPYENTFDVVFDSYGLCKDKSCRVTIDDQGRKLTSDIPWFTSFNSFVYLNPLENGSPNKGHLLMNVGMQGQEQMALLKANEIKDLRKPASDVQPMAISTAHNAASACYVDASNPENEKVTCVQYDLVTGEPKFQSSLNLGYASHFGSVHNLPEGKGFLLMTPECSDSRCYGTINRYHVNELTNDGRSAGNLLIEGPECPIYSNIISSFFENDAKQQCLTLLCFSTKVTNPDGDGWLKFVTKCFDGKDLRK